MGDTNGRFSSTYSEARDRFRDATSGGERGAIEVCDGLTIDWAWTGTGDARRVRLLTSGLHGIEGFPGSAAQLDMLDRRDDVRTLWVHALNPWGMANLRRVNENNVDLNRNFLAPGEAYAGAAEAYAALDGMLNPESPPAFDFFLVRAGWTLLRGGGLPALRDAIVRGQYDFPRGLFYGGARLEPGPERLLAFLRGALGGCERVVHVDLHSGLGRFCGRTLLLDGEPDPAQVARVRGAFGPTVKTWEAGSAEAYSIRGGFTAALARELPGVRYDALTCEFGTWSNVEVLHALREENRLHHWGTPRPDHGAKKDLRVAFDPDHPAFRGAVIAHARSLMAPTAKVLATD